jgi:hypothetical protein
MKKGISDILQNYIHTNSMGKKLLESPGTFGITSSISFAKIGSQNITRSL